MSNQILQRMRKQVYTHVERFIRPSSHILELNSGTGIDATYFISKGHAVHATDLSQGMIEQLCLKQKRHPNHLVVQELSYTNLDKLKASQDFDYVFSNFGGLNCCRDLRDVTRHLSRWTKSGGYVTWVIMPPACPTEWLLALKGNFKAAFRRYAKGGVVARLENHHFRTYYHSLKDIRSAFPEDFRLISCESLAIFSPQPHHAKFARTNPGINSLLEKIDNTFRKLFPFNCCGDHIIVTFQRR
jgi:SAM-dependent methyltransferase